MKQPSTVLECLPQLRLFAHVMYPDTTAADQAVEDCLARAKNRVLDLPDQDRIFLALLRDLAAAVRQGTQARVPDDGHSKQCTMQMLRKLPLHHRDVLITVTLFNLRYWEAADVCGCPVGTIKSRLSRARAAFAAAFESSSPGKAVSQRSLPSHAGLN